MIRYQCNIFVNQYLFAKAQTSWEIFWVIVNTRINVYSKLLKVCESCLHERESLLSSLMMMFISATSWKNLTKVHEMSLWIWQSCKISTHNSQMTERLNWFWKIEDQVKNEKFFVHKLQNLAVNLLTNKEKFDFVVAWSARDIVSEKHESSFSVSSRALKSMIWTSSSEDKCNALNITCLVSEKELWSRWFCVA